MLFVVTNTQDYFHVGADQVAPHRPHLPGAQIYKIKKKPKKQVILGKYYSCQGFRGLEVNIFM